METSQHKCALGVFTLSNYFYWAVLEQDGATLTLADRRREGVPKTMTTAQLMTWYSGRVSSLLESYKPTIVAARLPMAGRGFGLTTEFVEKAIFPNAIVHFLCQQKEPPIPVVDYIKQSFTAKRFGLTKPVGKKNTELLFEKCDSTFAHDGPYWDENQKETVLAAWLALRS
jgi:hypothetical protein